LHDVLSLSESFGRVEYSFVIGCLYGKRITLLYPYLNNLPDMRTLVVFISLLLFADLYSQKDNESWCQLHKAGSDGLKKDDDSYGFFKKGNFRYYLSNDNDNLYVDMKIEDSGVQNKILQEGLTVWISPNGKNVRKTGLRFPIGAKSSRGHRADSNGNGINSDSPLAMANTIELIGLSSSGPEMVPAGSHEGLSGSVKYDNDGILFYNLKIPLSEFNLKVEKSGSDAIPFSLGIEYGGSKASGEGQKIQAPPAADPVGMPSRSGRGGGSRGGGGRGGSGSAGGGMQSKSFANQAVELSIALWIKNIRLATQN
jgi:hypothetical protein